MAVLGQFQHDPGLGREGGDHLDRLRRERQRAGIPADGEHAAHVPRRAQRQQDGPPQRHVFPCHRIHPAVVAELLHHHRLAGGQHLPGQRLCGREHQPQRFVRGLPGRVGVDQPLLITGLHRERHQVGAGQRQRLPGDQVQHLRGLHPRQQLAGDLRGGPQPAFLPAGFLIQAGVVDRHARGGRERDNQRLVLLVELPPALLLGEVEVAVNLVPDPDRHAEERPHRRVPRREAV